MANVEKFKYWCNKILPLVYDDSLSYYEFLGKVYEKLNETIDAVNSNTEAVAEFDQRINDFIAAETAARESWEDQQERDRQSWETTETANRAAWENQQALKWAAFQAMFISEYDPDNAYVQGDLCSVQYKMYVAKSSTTGTFDPTKWDEIVLSDYLAGFITGAAADLQAQYDTFLETYQREFGVTQSIYGSSTTDALSQNGARTAIGDALHYTPIAFINDYYIPIPDVGEIADITPVSFATYQYAISDIKPGQTVTVNVRTGAGADKYGVAFLDADNYVLERYLMKDTNSLNAAYVAPATATKVVVNNLTFFVPNPSAFVGDELICAGINNKIIAPSIVYFKDVESGEINSITGERPSTVSDATRYLINIDNIAVIDSGSSNATFNLFAYEGTEYIGCYNGYGFLKLRTALSKIDLRTLPDYWNYVIEFNREYGDDIRTALSKINVYLFVNEKTEHNEQQINDVGDMAIQNYHYTANDGAPGGLNPMTGETTTTARRFRVDITDEIIINSENGVSFNLFAYKKSDDTFVGDYTTEGFGPTGNVPPLTSFTVYDLPTDYYYKLVIKYDSGTLNDALENVTFTAPVKRAVKNNADLINDLQDELSNISSKIYPFYTAEDDVTMVTSATAVYALYDDLVTNYSDYVSRQALTSGNVTCYEYTFTTPNYNGQGGNRPKTAEVEKPVILITAGVHGDERSAVMSTYHFFRDLCEGKNGLSEIKNSLAFKLIPVVCAWGYTNNKRWNENGVNINRNFDADWTASGEAYTNNYSGPSAASEDETKIVQNWLNNNTNAFFYIDYHNSGYANEISYWGAPTANVDQIEEFRKSVNLISEYWATDREIDQYDNIYEYTGGSMYINGSTEKYGVNIGLDASTFEASWNIFGVIGDNATIATGSEALCNLLRSLT